MVSGLMRREERLTKRQQYAAVYSKGSSWTSSLLVMKALPNGLTSSRYGISVGKRVGSAVIRNRMKRLLREILRITPIIPAWDIVFIVRPAASTTDYASLREAVEDLLCRAGLLNEEEEYSTPGEVKAGINGK